MGDKVLSATGFGGPSKAERKADRKIDEMLAGAGAQGTDITGTGGAGLGIARDELTGQVTGVDISGGAPAEERVLEGQKLASAILGGIGGTPEEVTQAEFQRGLSLLQPGFQDARRSLENQLVQRGIPLDSEAAQRELNRLETQQGEQTARLQQSALTQGRQARASDISALTGILGATGQDPTQRLNELQLGLQAAGMEGFSPLQARLDREAGTVAAEQAERAGRQKQTSELIGTAVSAAPMLFSDAIVKENIEKAGELPNGITVYEYNYRGDSQRTMGVMAQEVLKVLPDAVTKCCGIFKVDYSKVLESVNG
jgi:hypothetical protein